jgi:hypothetical protein
LLDPTSHGCAAGRPLEPDARRETFNTDETHLRGTMRRRHTDATAAAPTAASLARVRRSTDVETLGVDAQIIVGAL